MTGGAATAALPAAAPLSPERDEARQWAERELSDPAYDAAEPTFLDRIAQAVADFVGSLFGGQLPEGWGATVAVIAGIVVVLLVLAGLLIWGRPRPTARVRQPTTDLFGDSDERSAADLRREAAAAASAADWDEAIVLRFRALARGLGERTIVEVSAGTTVHGFARAAAGAFPAETSRMDAAAAAFDDVRYLRRPGTEEVYRAVVALDDHLARARPAATAAA